MFFNLPRHLNTVYARHHQVKYQYVWIKLFNQIKRLQSIGCFSDDAKIRLLFEQRPESQPDNLVVICEYDCYCVHVVLWFYMLFNKCTNSLDHYLPCFYVIPVEAGLQKGKKTGFRIKPGMTIKVKGLMTHYTIPLPVFRQPTGFLLPEKS